MPRNFTLLFAKAALVAKSWDLLSPSIFEELERRRYVCALSAPCRAASQGMPGGGTQVLPAKLGPEAGLLGDAFCLSIPRCPLAPQHDSTFLPMTCRLRMRCPSQCRRIPNCGVNASVVPEPNIE